jgi:hypothetical protein
MVLKYLTKCEVGVRPGEKAEKVFRDQWNFIDGIIGASVYYDDVTESVIADLEFESRPPMKIAVPSEAYLLNENGKTIEKVRI